MTTHYFPHKSITDALFETMTETCMEGLHIEDYLDHGGSAHTVLGTCCLSSAVYRMEKSLKGICYDRHQRLYLHHLQLRMAFVGGFRLRQPFSSTFPFFVGNRGKRLFVHDALHTTPFMTRTSLRGAMATVNLFRTMSLLLGFRSET